MVIFIFKYLIVIFGDNWVNNNIFIVVGEIINWIENVCIGVMKVFMVIIKIVVVFDCRFVYISLWFFG